MKKRTNSEFEPFLGSLIVDSGRLARNAVALDFLVGFSVGSIAMWLIMR